MHNKLYIYFSVLCTHTMVTFRRNSANHAGLPIFFPVQILHFFFLQPLYCGVSPAKIHNVPHHTPDLDIKPSCIYPSCTAGSFTSIIPILLFYKFLYMYFFTRLFLLLFSSIIRLHVLFTSIIPLHAFLLLQLLLLLFSIIRLHVLL